MYSIGYCEFCLGYMIRIMMQFFAPYLITKCHQNGIY